MKKLGAILCKQIEEPDILMKDVYQNTMSEIVQKDDRVILLDSDLALSLGIKEFIKNFPDKIIDCGIQEANMIGVAAGLSSVGKVPYTHTFAVFATRRVFDQVFISGAYAKQNIRIIGSDPGISAEYNGGTHMAFEDTGIMRTIPGMTIIEPTDMTMLKDILHQLVDLYGMYYIRMIRKKCKKIYEEGSTFEIGKANLLKDGKDATIIASGIMVYEALEAEKILKGKGIDTRVIDMFTIKPIDSEIVIKAAIETGAVVTAENHNVINGLGSAVAEVLCENCPVPMGRIGVNDTFGEVGPMKYLKEKFGMTALDIAHKVEKVLGMKLKIE